MNNAKEDAAEVAVKSVQGQGQAVQGMAVGIGVGQQGIVGVIGR